MATYKELLAQHERLTKELNDAKAKETDKALAKVMELVQEFDITQEQIFPRATGKRGPSAGSQSALKGMKLPPLFRDPEDKNLTWTGRGQTPKWMKARIEAGMKKEDLKIK